MFDEVVHENDFYIFVPNDLDLKVNLKLAPLATLVRGQDSAELEISTAFLFQENQSHGTDRQRRTLCNA